MTPLDLDARNPSKDIQYASDYMAYLASHPHYDGRDLRGGSIPKGVKEKTGRSETIQCPECGSRSSAVADSRPHHGWIRRRRFCHDCEWRYTTYEIPAAILKTYINAQPKVREAILSDHFVEELRALIERYGVKFGG